MDDKARALSKVAVRRAGGVLLAVGLCASWVVYLGHAWFHAVLLPSLGVGAALGDALGGFVIVLVAFFAQRAASSMLFDDPLFGLVGSAQRLLQANTRLRASLDELDQIASMDRLTGCWNRRGLENIIAGEVDRVARYGHSLSMLVIDVDHFKAVNDTHGHTAGDAVLMELATLLRRGLRTSDALARWGGEEFVVICPDTALTTAVALAERLRDDISRARVAEVGSLTVSIGVAECLLGEPWRTWLDRADGALYRAKHNGRNQVQFAPETPPRLDSLNALGTRLVQLSWFKGFECGHEDIDRDHRAMFALANELLEGIVAGRPGEETAQLARTLVQEITAHFTREEQILAAVGYPGAAAHAEMHRDLSGKAAAMLGESMAGTVEPGALFQFLAHDVIAKHLLGADRAFFPIFQAGTEIPARTESGLAGALPRC